MLVVQGVCQSWGWQHVPTMLSLSFVYCFIVTSPLLNSLSWMKASERDRKREKKNHKDCSLPNHCSVWAEGLWEEHLQQWPAVVLEFDVFLHRSATKWPFVYVIDPQRLRPCLSGGPSGAAKLGDIPLHQSPRWRSPLMGQRNQKRSILGWDSGLTRLLDWGGEKWNNL